MEKSRAKTSKRLAFLLRHSQSPRFISSFGGWAEVEAILKELQIEREYLEELVEI